MQSPPCGRTTLVVAVIMLAGLRRIAAADRRARLLNMSVYKRKSGRYIVVLAKAEGSVERRSLGTFPTRKDAEKAEREALNARDRGTDLVPQTLTLAEVFAAYMAEAAADGLSETTLRGYRETFRRCETIATTRLAKLKPLHVAQLRTMLLSQAWSEEPAHWRRDPFATRLHSSLRS